MLYLDDRELNTLPCVCEGIYLGEKFSDRLGNSGIFVCPENINYLTGKTVIINQLWYPEENCKILLDNGCKLISRINLPYISKYPIKFQPYILRPELGVMWNGMLLNVDGIGLEDLLEKLEGSIIFNLSQSELYFPKLIGLDENLIRDNDNNLTALGWLMHQVGINTSKSSVFQDMDLLKTKKMLF